MSKFQCKKYHGKCKAECCGIVPIPKVLWQKKQHAIQRTILYKAEVIGKNPDTGEQQRAIVAFTEDNYCPFLKKDLSCAIYEDRPPVCKKYGDESHAMMCCPMQDKDGNPREE